MRLVQSMERGTGAPKESMTMVDVNARSRQQHRILREDSTNRSSTKIHLAMFLFILLVLSALFGFEAVNNQLAVIGQTLFLIFSGAFVATVIVAWYEQWSRRASD